jgi:hypothetical protein
MSDEQLAASRVLASRFVVCWTSAWRDRVTFKVDDAFADRAADYF